MLRAPRAVVAIAVAVTASFAWAAPAHAQCSSQWDYPGCTVAQMRQLEAPDRPTTKEHYTNDRWGQGRIWANVSDDFLDRMRREYNEAVDRFEGRAAGKGAEAAYPTWAEFKDAAADACGGSFGFGPMNWCIFSDKTQDLLVKASDPAVKFTLWCGSHVFGGVFGTATLAKILVTPLAPAALEAGAAAGLVTCTIDKMFDFIGMAVGDKGARSHRPAARQHEGEPHQSAHTRS